MLAGCRMFVTCLVFGPAINCWQALSLTFNGPEKKKKYHPCSWRLQDAWDVINQQGDKRGFVGHRGAIRWTCTLSSRHQRLWRCNQKEKHQHYLPPPVQFSICSLPLSLFSFDVTQLMALAKAVSCLPKSVAAEESFTHEPLLVQPVK